MFGVSNLPDRRQAGLGHSGEEPDMKILLKKNLLLAVLTACIVLLVLPVSIMGAQVTGNEISKVPPLEEAGYVTIDFDDVDIRVFIKFISELTGSNFVIDKRSQGKGYYNLPEENLSQRGIQSI